MVYAVVEINKVDNNIKYKAMYFYASKLDAVKAMNTFVDLIPDKKFAVIDANILDWTGEHNCIMIGCIL